jgi:hypothetical protein
MRVTPNPAAKPDTAMQIVMQIEAAFVSLAKANLAPVTAYKWCDAAGPMQVQRADKRFRQKACMLGITVSSNAKLLSARADFDGCTGDP